MCRGSEAIVVGTVRLISISVGAVRYTLLESRIYDNEAFSLRKSLFYQGRFISILPTGSDLNCNDIML